ncbi:MAG: GIY-YIG nuclease family protein [Gallionella sp.]
MIRHYLNDRPDNVSADNAKKKTHNQLIFAGAGCLWVVVVCTPFLNAQTERQDSIMSIVVKWLSHEFKVHEHGANWNDVPGVYIFAGLNHLNLWKPLYIGQAASFQNRIPSHEQWLPARKHGATHVHAIAINNQTQRDEIEMQLIKAFQPPLNTQLK